MTRRQRIFLLLAAILGGVAVGLGAFGAHGLKVRVSSEMLEVWETAVRYQFYHTLALLGCALGTPLWQGRTGFYAQGACWFWILGIAVFSGSLYALVLSDLRVLGAVTPLGGVALIFGWGFLAMAAWNLRFPLETED